MRFSAEEVARRPAPPTHAVFAVFAESRCEEGTARIAEWRHSALTTGDFQLAGRSAAQRSAAT